MSKIPKYKQFPSYNFITPILSILIVIPHAQQSLTMATNPNQPQPQRPLPQGDTQEDNRPREGRVLS